MSSPIRVVRGVRAVRRLLREAVGPRTLDVEGFRRWLLQQCARWQRDAAFSQRVRIREVRRAHPELQTLERACRHAAAEERASPQHARLAQVEEALERAGKAVAGLGAALEEAAPERRVALQHKRAAFAARQEALRAEQQQLLQESPSRQELLRLQARLARLRAVLGLDAEEARLAVLLREQGRRTGSAGHAFEALALAVTWQKLVPELLRTRAPEALARVRVLRGVTLGAAGTELDQLVVRLPHRAGQPVDVLALVEVKRNPNDVAHGFRQRQENLAWLTGDTARDAAAQHRTRHFRTGHFDREAVHEEEGERFVFTSRSFRRFRREPHSGLFLERLAFITRPGPLTGLSTAALSRLRHRVATDVHWQPESDAWMAGLLQWCQSLAAPLETPDVLRRYGETPWRARQVLLVHPARAPAPSRTAS